MYLEYYGLKEFPFSIAPDPRFLFLSDRHKEALAHLLYGVQGQGGFILLTGEVGTGKTTVCKSFLDQLPEATDVAYIVNPKLSARELLSSICDELNISQSGNHTLYSIKHYTDAINHYLLTAHSNGRHTVLIIDEAQNLSVEVLEQIRLLTNLETSEKKLLQIILLGQPELKDLIAKPELRQLSQRVTARYHLDALGREEVDAYIKFRLYVAGRQAPVFSSSALKTVFKKSRGIPRLVNLICDRALLMAYASEAFEVTPAIVRAASKEAMGDISHEGFQLPQWANNSVLVCVGAAGVAFALILIVKLLSSSLSSNDYKQDIHYTAERPIPKNSVTSEADNSGTTNKPVTTIAPEPVQQAEDSELIERLRRSAAESPVLLHQAILNAWSFSPNEPLSDDNKQFCNQIYFFGYDCAEQIGSWRQLIEVNHPSILRLRFPLEQEKEILLLSVDGDEAEIFDGDRMSGSFRLPVRLLQQYWYGKFRFIWQVPSYRSPIVLPGQISEESDWLTNAFDIIKLRYQKTRPEIFKHWPEAQAFDSHGKFLKAQVKYFQAVNGLESDGIVGQQTEIKINHFLDSSAPKLHNEYK